MILTGRHSIATRSMAINFAAVGPVNLPGDQLARAPRPVLLATEK